MKTLFVTVVNETGLHARPAKLFSQTAQQFDSEIKAAANGRSVNAKNMIAVLSLGVSAGTKLQIEISGSDENEAAAALKELFDNNLNEG